MKILSLIIYVLVTFHIYSAYSAQRPIAKPVAVNIITDDNGVKLYVLELDSNHEINCYGDCTRDWPEIKLKKRKQAQGNGGVQLTLNNKPVKEFDQNTQTSRNGSDREANVWHIVTP